MRLALEARWRGGCAGGPLDVLNRRAPKRLLAVRLSRVCLGVRAARLQHSRATLTRHGTGAAKPALRLTETSMSPGQIL